MLLFSQKEPVWVFGTNENICINYCMLMMKDNYGYDDEKAGWWRHPRYSDWNPFITINLARAPAYLMKQHLPNEMFWSDKHFRQKDEEEDDPAALVGSFKRCHLFSAPAQIIQEYMALSQTIYNKIFRGQYNLLASPPTLNSYLYIFL